MKSFKVCVAHRKNMKVLEYKNVTKIQINSTTGVITLTYGTSSPQETETYSKDDYRTIIVEG